MKIIIIVALLLIPFSVVAQNFILKRVVITWDGGLVDDSLIVAGKFTANGDMSIVGNKINQNITFCYSGVCDRVIENGGGLILDVAENTARITARNDDGDVGELTILSLYPNIITMYVYDDGTAETHEWEPAP